MAITTFTLASIADMDNGRIRVAFEQALRRLELDCKDRPALLSARKLELCLEMKPVTAPSGDLDSVNVSFRIKDSVPKRQSKTYNMQAVAGGLLFNELSEADVRQKTLDMAPAPRSTKPGRKDATGEEVSDVG